MGPVRNVEERALDYDDRCLKKSSRGEDKGNSSIGSRGPRTSRDLISISKNALYSTLVSQTATMRSRNERPVSKRVCLSLGKQNHYARISVLDPHDPGK